MTEKFVILRYSSYVAEMLEGDCAVHHSPWSWDGGALDTNHILKCLPLLLSSSVYEPVQYDAIIFNSGLHDVNCCNFPREVKGHSNVGYKYMKDAVGLSARVDDAMMVAKQQVKELPKRFSEFTSYLSPPFQNSPPAWNSENLFMFYRYVRCKLF